MVSFTYGTEVFRGDAPSESPAGFEPGPAYTYASAGFAVSDPDYLGLGTWPGLHPWMDVPSETTAALDVRRAARAFVVSHGRTMVPGRLSRPRRARASRQPRHLSCQGSRHLGSNVADTAQIVRWFLHLTH